MPLVRLLYLSENHIDAREGRLLTQVKDILSTSQRNNREVGLTGLLLFDDLWFVQILEGERAKVLETFERIGEDTRHKGVVLVEMVEIDERSFGKWEMSLVTRNPKTAAAFERHGVGGRFRPVDLPARSLLDLARELSPSADAST